MTRGQLRASMGTGEYNEWIAFYNVEAKERKKEADMARQRAAAARRRSRRGMR